MLKRCMAIGLVAVLMACLFFTTVFGVHAFGEEMSIHEMLTLEQFRMKNIQDTYKDRDDFRTASVWFSPALLLQDAREFSGEMAKSSVALAMAAYDEYYVEMLLENMGFTVESNAFVYERSREMLTLYDCDYVAYTIAYQDVVHPVTGAVHRIYRKPPFGQTGYRSHP